MTEIKRVPGDVRRVPAARLRGRDGVAAMTGAVSWQCFIRCDQTECDIVYFNVSGTSSRIDLRDHDKNDGRVGRQLAL